MSKRPSPSASGSSSSSAKRTHIEHNGCLVFGIGLDPERCFLSTLYRRPLQIQGRSYISVEHYYQSGKYEHAIHANAETAEYHRLLLACDSNFKAIALGCRRKHRFSSQWLISRAQPQLGTVDAAIDRLAAHAQRQPDWHAHNRAAMRRGLEARFREPKLRAQLAATAPLRLLYVQPSSHYWAWACTHESSERERGANVLGELLMELRAEFLQ